MAAICLSCLISLKSETPARVALKRAGDAEVSWGTVCNPCVTGTVSLHEQSLKSGLGGRFRLDGWSGWAESYAPPLCVTSAQFLSEDPAGTKLLELEQSFSCLSSTEKRMAVLELPNSAPA